MAWTPSGENPIISVGSNAINVQQFSGDPEAASDRITLTALNVDEGADVVTTANSEVLPDGLFYSSIPGEYELDLMLKDDLGNVLSAQLQTVRVCASFRRYIVPSDCVILDLNVPAEDEMDAQLGFPTGRSIVNILNNTEEVTLEMLHPENDTNLRSNVVLDFVKPTSSQFVFETVSLDLRKFHAEVPDDDAGWVSSPANVYNTQQYRYKDFVISRVGIRNMDLDPAKLKRKLAPFNDILVVRVWDKYIATKVPSSMAVVDDRVLQQMLAHANPVTLGRFTGTVRVRGVTGTPTGAQDGAAVTANMSGDNPYRSVLLDAWQSVQPTDWTISPKSLPQVFQSQAYAVDLSVLNPSDPAYTRKGVDGVNAYDCKPDPKYNWLVHRLDPDGRFKLAVLPLCIDPYQVPVFDGYHSVLPLQFFIHDTVAPGQRTSCPRPITFEFPGDNTMFRFITPGLPLSATAHSARRVFAATETNKLECSTVYTMWFLVPGDPTHPDEELWVNGEPFVTFSLRAMNLSPAPTNLDEIFGDVNRFISMGNYMHLVDAVQPEGNSLMRAVQLNWNIGEYFLSLGNAESVRQGGYQLNNESSMTMNTVYWLGNNNWMGCIDENWIDKTQLFLNARGWASSTFMDFLKGPTEFEAATNHGLSLGLPLGISTAYFTGAPAFNIDRMKVSLIYIVNFFTGYCYSMPLVIDWNGCYRAVFMSIYAPVDPNMTPGTQQDFEDYGPAGVWLRAVMNEIGGPLDAYDVYWWDFVVNSRQNSGIRVDGLGNRRFLLDANHLEAYDPTADPPIAIVDTSFSYVGSYNDNMTLPLNTQQIVAGHLEIAASVQVYVADAKYTSYSGQPVLDKWGNVIPQGLQKIDWQRQYDSEFRPL